jgi:hypothetical protein
MPRRSKKRRFDELDMFEIEAALHHAKIDTLVERLNKMLFRAGYIHAMKNPSEFFPRTPSTLYVCFDENFGNIDMSIYITDDCMERYDYDIPGIRLDQDDLDAHITLMKRLLKRAFFQVIFENDWQVCEANLVHGKRTLPSICTEVDGVWMCDYCYAENERNPNRE